jgi:hypothetical protein
MKSIKQIKQLFLFIPAVLIYLSGYGQFKADMHFITGGKERIFKVFSDNENYRYEFDEAGQQGVVISKQGSNEITILMPQQKIAMKSSAGSPMTMGNDPVKVYEYYRNKNKIEQSGEESSGTGDDTNKIFQVGKETVNGVECTKSELWNKNENVNQKMFTIWYSEKYNFPVKIVNHIDVSGQAEMELKNISTWIPESDSFKIPDGYQIMEVPQTMPQK